MQITYKAYCECGKFSVESTNRVQLMLAMFDHYENDCDWPSSEATKGA